MMAYDRPTKKQLDEFANAVIKLYTLSGSTRTSFVRIEQEMYNEVFKKVPGWSQCYCTGSYYESMPGDVCGDRDMMITERNFPIVLFDSASFTDQHTYGYVNAEYNTNEPLYLKLKAVEKDGLHAGIRNIIDKNENLKTTEFIELNRKNIAKDSDVPEGLFTYSKYGVQENYERHGPSLAVDINLTGLGYDNIVNMDFVYCLRCQSWPSITDSFFTRQRPGNWPSEELLNRVSRLECLVVAVSRTDSLEVTPEWRLSFSLAEKELIHHMSEPYLQCLYALKAIKNKYIVYSESDKPTPFCSYFIKTACLWMCETFPHKEHSTMDLIRKTIGWLIDCYQRRILQNYFIPEQNLIGSLSRERCDGVKNRLRAIKKDLWRMLLSSIPMPLFVREVVVHPMCEQLNILKINEGDDYGDLETSIRKHPQGSDILKHAIQYLMPGGYINVLYGSLENSLWTGKKFGILFKMIDVLVKDAKFNVDEDAIFDFPEQIIMPIVHRLGTFIPDGNAAELFKQRLYRLLGEAYTYLLIYFCKVGCTLFPHSQIHWRKPLHYYELGTGIRPCEKWSDYGMVGHVSVVIHHYLMDNYRELKEKLIKLTPVALKINNDLIAMSRQINIEISADYFVANWSTDTILHNITKTQKGLFAFNPVTLVFYINARLHLREGDVDSARIMVNEMKKCLILRGDASLSAKLLSRIIQSLIGLLVIARSIYSTCNEVK